MPIIEFEGDKIEFPDHMMDEEINDVLGGLRAAGTAVVEVGATIGSAAASEPVAGLTALGTGDANAVEGMMSRMTYQPTTDVGRRAMARLGADIQALSEATGLDHMSGYWRDRVVPALQEQAGPIAGSALAAAGLTALTFIGEASPGGKAAGATRRFGMGEEGALKLFRGEGGGQTSNGNWFSPSRESAEQYARGGDIIEAAPENIFDATDVNELKRVLGEDSAIAKEIEEVGNLSGAVSDEVADAIDLDMQRLSDMGHDFVAVPGWQEPVEYYRPPKKGITAYHGSPHDFDEFKMSQIGTGEGAQAYGHGLYFAESEDVAKGYRDELSDAMTEARYTLGGNEYQRGSPEWKAIGTVQNDGLESAQELSKIYSNDLAAGEKYVNADFVNRYNEALRQLESGAEVGEARGRMYQVNIDASPDELLDWDAPLSGQSDKVRAALSDYKVVKNPDPDSFHDEKWLIEFNGETLDAYKTKKEAQSVLDTRSVAGFYSTGGVKAKPLREGFSQEMTSRGIKGIKYKDGFSRGAEGGTSNYVIFDERLISIAKKYGLSIPAAAALLAEQTDEDTSGMYQEAM